MLEFQVTKSHLWSKNANDINSGMWRIFNGMGFLSSGGC